MIEFPVLDNFFYRDELDSSNPEILMTKKSFNLLKDSADILKINTINCLTIKKIIQTNDTLDLKFLKAKSEKKYYLKIKRYRSGKTIIFEDDGFDIFLDKISKENIFKLKKQNCGGYKYFSGSFKFYPEKIILP